MNNPPLNIDQATLIIDFFHRLMMHHAMWFSEVRHQLGDINAYEILQNAYEKSYHIQMKRMAKTLGFELENDIPKPLLNLDEQTLNALKESMAINWLANDGVWFQAIEFSRGMYDAKRVNDSCWSNFSPFEAWSIKRLLNLPEKSGLDGLKQALELRLYATINTQSIVNETDTSFDFQMNQCRVQAARNRKGLDDYPCKSGGMAEYPRFAESIDPRIQTTCIGCPPDKHPEEWFCAWRFSLQNS
jgi:hypothetical protein